MQKALFILEKLNDADLDWLATKGRQELVPAGTRLITEGQSVDTLYILLDGTLIVSISALEGRQIARLSSGEVVGEMSFVESLPPSATVQTLEPSMVLAIPRSLLLDKLHQDPGFGCRFYQALAILLSRRLRGTVKQLSSETESHSFSETLETEAADTLAAAQAKFESLLKRLPCSAN